MGNLFRHPRGSEWRKWDLHLHGPEDKLQNLYTGDADEKWEDFLTQVEKTDLAVIGFTNYFSIAGLERAIDYRKNGNRLRSVECIIPNIEFRLDNTNKDGQHINIHIFFSENVKISDISLFLSQLELVNTRANGTRLYCTDEHLSEIGYDNATVGFDKLKAGLEGSFRRDDYLIAAVCNGYGSLRLREGQSEASGRTGHVAQELDKMSDLYFGKAENKAYYLKTDRYKGCIPKPVVLGSDSHGNKSLGVDATWIKADPTFEGLRQVIFEPDLRVQICDQEPESKKDYFVISKFRFADNSGKNLFPGMEFPLNKSLNAIIGGKSTGKSLLLHYLAKAIDPNEVKERQAIFGESPPGYDFEDNSDFDFEVEWSDGITQSIRATDVGATRKIVYIPQHYLNRLSEADVASKQSLNEFIFSVLIQDEKAHSEYTTHKKRVEKSVKEIEVKVSEYFKLSKEAEAIKESIKEKGDESGVKKYLGKIEEEIKILKGKSGLTDEQLQSYESLSKSESETQASIDELEHDLEKINELGEEVGKHVQDAISTLASTADYLKSGVSKKTIDAELSFLKDLPQILSAKIANTKQTIETETKKLDERIKKTRQDLTPLLSRVKMQDELKEKEDRRKAEKEKLTQIKILKDSLQKMTSKGNAVLEEVVEVYRSIFDEYKDLQSKFKAFEKGLQDISLNVNVKFMNSRFTENMTSRLNVRELKNAIKLVDGEYVFQQDSHVHSVSKLVHSIVEGTVKPKAASSEKDAIINALQDFYYLDFQLTYKRDAFARMSPGKKGLILLRLLIELSDKEWPILLDQPEDDLDNRSVYSDLVSFIREKKADRQIILVTHNPNLVVGGDAEEVIVANQEGQEDG